MGEAQPTRGGLTRAHARVIMGRGWGVWGEGNP
jgi:hypothetical protein